VYPLISYKYVLGVPRETHVFGFFMVSAFCCSSPLWQYYLLLVTPKQQMCLMWCGKETVDLVVILQHQQRGPQGLWGPQWKLAAVTVMDSTHQGDCRISFSHFILTCQLVQLMIWRTYAKSPLPSLSYHLPLNLICIALLPFPLKWIHQRFSSIHKSIS
jgi:hypothetical protein